MDFELVVVNGRSVNQTLKLSDGVTTLGRHDDCQLRIKSSQVSRRHCALFEKKGLLLVKDLGSSNGTYVNGKRIQEQRVLEPGDEIMIGQVKLRVAKVGQVPPPLAPPKSSKPGDTAIVEPVPTGGEDEFDGKPVTTEDVPIADIEEEPIVSAAPKAEAAPSAPPKPKPKAKPAVPAPEEDAIADFLLDFKIDNEDAPAPAAPKAAAEAKKAEPAAKPKSKSEPEPVPAPEPPGSDDAIADFLLDIKLDEEDE